MKSWLLSTPTLASEGLDENPNNDNKTEDLPRGPPLERKKHVQ